MSHEAARQLITFAVKDTLDGSSLATKSLVHWPFLPFKRPENPPWHRVNIIPGDTEPAALGSSFTRTPFVVIIQTFLAEDQSTGTKPAWDLADALVGMDGTIHRSDDGLTNVFFRTWSPPQEGPATGGLTPFNVTIRGYFDTQN